MSQYNKAEFWYHAGNEFDENKIDVFYIVSTMVMESRDEEGNLLDCSSLCPEDIALLDQELDDVSSNMFDASKFNFIAPYYHQATMEATLRVTAEERDGLLEQARQEINQAFAYYMAVLNQGRPFILAGFSQGAFLAKALLKDMTSDDYGCLIAAYLLGCPITEEDLQHKHIKPAKGPKDFRATVSFNSVASLDACFEPLTEGAVACINPVNWRTDSTPAEFTYDGQTVTVHIDDEKQVLVVEGLDPQKYYDPAWPFPLGNYHSEEIHFYAEAIQYNALNRAAPGPYRWPN